MIGEDFVIKAKIVFFTTHKQFAQSLPIEGSATKNTTEKDILAPASVRQVQVQEEIYQNLLL